MAGSEGVNAQVETVVDLDAIAHNVRILREFAGEAEVMAVVKADGYNHGATEVARAALAAGAKEIGVTTIAEALTLRAAGITAPILSWLNTTDADYAGAVAADIELGLSTYADLIAVEKAARHVGRTATVSLKVDTGLNRNGIPPEELPRVLTALRPLVAEGAVRLRAMFSHLACADDPNHPATDMQRDRFLAAIGAARECGLEPERVHLANTPATLLRPDLAFDMVRPGIALYGLNPVPHLIEVDLRPAMTFQARVIQVKRVAAGEGVSYGHNWIAERDTTVALIPAGYADGVFRTLSGRFGVRLGGALRPNIGRVCMDQFVVDLGDNAEGVAAGDIAVLFGGGPGEPRARDWADQLGTIDYEIVCAPRARVHRRHIGGPDSGGELR
ncbi:alanine racemase [Nocardia panacis]|uniref:Alanine racemase n=1 Tax=Nocardia panacis TaxID=2340916 RepID=A0A3A4KAR3_9NOCA|nr:alanine racemase [Nocardia panacis]RJO72158.1 alanine racemase [Nocardia panacis]